MTDALDQATRAQDPIEQQTIEQQLRGCGLQVTAQRGAPGLVDANPYSHDQVSSQLGAPDDGLVTPPVTDFVRSCTARRCQRRGANGAVRSRRSLDGRARGGAGGTRGRRRGLRWRGNPVPDDVRRDLVRSGRHADRGPRRCTADRAVRALGCEPHGQEHADVGDVLHCVFDNPGHRSGSEGQDGNGGGSGGSLPCVHTVVMRQRLIVAPPEDPPVIEPEVDALPPAEPDVQETAPS